MEVVAGSQLNSLPLYQLLFLIIYIYCVFMILTNYINHCILYSLTKEKICIISPSFLYAVSSSPEKYSIGKVEKEREKKISCLERAGEGNKYC